MHMEVIAEVGPGGVVEFGKRSMEHLGEQTGVFFRMDFADARKIMNNAFGARCRITVERLPEQGRLDCKGDACNAK